MIVFNFTSAKNDFKKIAVVHYFNCNKLAGVSYTSAFCTSARIQ
jgi:hypothetical protein